MLENFTGYEKKNWKNSPDKTTPLSAENLDHMDSGIKMNADAVIELREQAKEQKKKTDDALSAVNTNIASIAIIYKNIVDDADLINGFTGPDGNKSSVETWKQFSVTVKSGDSYSFTGGRKMVCFYNGSATSQNVVSGGEDTSNDILLNVPSNASLMNVSFQTKDLDNITVVQSDVILSKEEAQKTYPAEKFNVYSKEKCDKLIDDITPDDTAVGGKPWTSKHIVDMLCPPLKVAGNPVQCYPVAGYPLGITASWEPTQEGTGDPSPDNIRPIKGRNSVAVTRCGANLFDYEKFKQVKCVGGTAVYENNGVTVTANKNDCYTAYLKTDGFPDDCRIPVKPGGTITFSWEESTNTSGLVFIFPNAKSAGSVVVNNASKKSLSYTVTEGVSFISYRFGVTNAGDTIAYKNIQCTVGSEAPTEYQPYISDTVTLALPETIYGGSVNAVSGEGESQYNKVNIRMENLNYNINISAMLGYASQNLLNDIQRPSSNSIAFDGVCDCLPTKSASEINSGAIGFGVSASGDIYLKAEGLDSAEAYAAKFPNGVNVCYKVATPKLFSATGNAPVPALVGINTVLTDADSVEVTGREDLIHAIAGQ